MVDFPEVPGKMCNWQVIEATTGAKEALTYLSQRASKKGGHFRLCHLAESRCQILPFMILLIALLLMHHQHQAFSSIQ